MSFRTYANILEARVSIRSFTPEILPIEESKNTQPWGVHLVRGAALEGLREQYVQAFETGLTPTPDYAYSQSETAVWKERAKQVGIALFTHKGIGREDKDKRHAHNKANYQFFDAAQVFFISVPEEAGLGNHMDCGSFLSNVLNGITAKGWGACPSMAAAHYPEIVRQFVPGLVGRRLVCGIPFGIPDEGHVNSFRTVRAEVDEWLEVVE
jgi:nitroreductase